jgi:trimeric autotransporter adhesin
MATNNPFDPNALANGTSTLTMRTTALAQSEDLVQAGVVFNDATRLLEGGLWSTPADNNNQQAYLGMYTTDLHAVSNDVAAILANPAGTTVGGVAYTPTTTDIATLTEIQGQLQTLITEAPQSVGNASAEQTVHALHTEILSEIAGDSTLAAAINNVQFTSGTGANDVGFQLLPAGADDPATVAAATAQGATLATIGQVFNAAADLAVGGINASNLTEFDNDMKTVATGISNILNNPTELAQIETGEQGAAAALTTVHLDTILNQIDLQINKFDPLYATDPNVAARSTNDNTLDIIDIVQNDANLNAAAGGNGNPGSVGGFAEFPAYLNGAGGVNAHGGTILQFQDDQPQTNFWATFLSEANTINTALQAVAANQDTPAQIQALITQIQNYQQFGANFDAAQGGVFGARFDNELLSGTLLADTNNAVHGLTGIANGDVGPALTADQAQILAAGSGFVADANDVSGNNLPIGGGSFVGTATTVATATSTNGVAMGSIPVTAAPDIANGVGAVGEASSTGGAPAPAGGAPAPTGGTPTPTGSDPAGGSHGAGPTAGESANVAADIAALIQALQGGNQNAVNAAVAALGADVHAGGGSSGSGNNGSGGGTGGSGAGDPGPGSTTGEHHHFEHFWHHA